MGESVILYHCQGVSFTSDFLLEKIIQFILRLDGFTGGLGRGWEGDDDDAHVVTTPLKMKRSGTPPIDD